MVFTLRADGSINYSHFTFHFPIAVYVFVCKMQRLDDQSWLFDRTVSAWSLSFGWMAKSGGRSEEGVAGTKRQKGAPTYYLAKRKLHENERNWTKGMSVPGDPLPRSGNGNICAF